MLVAAACPREGIARFTSVPFAGDDALTALASLRTLVHSRKTYSSHLRRSISYTGIRVRDVSA